MMAPAQERYYNLKDRERFLKLLEEKGEVRDFEVRLKRKEGLKRGQVLGCKFLFSNSFKKNGRCGAVEKVSNNWRCGDGVV